MLRNLYKATVFHGRADLGEERKLTWRFLIELNFRAFSTSVICADGPRCQDGPRWHLDARAGVRHSPPLIGDDFKACPWSTGICVPVECGRGGGWCFRRLCADAIHVECERARVCEPHLCSGGYNPAFEKHAYEPRARKARVRKRGPRKWGPRFWNQEGQNGCAGSTRTC